MTNLHIAKELLSSGNLLESYTAYPGIIHKDFLSKDMYLRLATALWKMHRHQEAELVLEAANEKFTKFVASAELYDSIRADRSIKYDFAQTPLSDRRFHLESLRGVSLKKDQLTIVPLGGWIQVSEPDSELLIQEDNRPERVEKLSISRQDVVRYLGRYDINNQIEYCGFLFNLDLTGRVRISLRSPTKTEPVVDLAPRRILQVLEGRDGWLFLDNDTNRSSDLFTGRWPVDASDVENWLAFARKAQSALDALGIASCLAICPAKEDVFPEFHPLVPARISLLDTIISALFTAGVRVSCPIRRYRQEPASYYRTDTHWSDLGAWICVQDILELLDIALPANFSLKFTDIEVPGDLGSKLSPATKSIRKILESKSRNIQTIFKNNSNRSSHISIYRNPDFVVDKKIMIFGASSSAQMTTVFSEIFRQTTRIISQFRMPIIEVIERAKPDIVILQINARFMKTRPRLSKTIADSSLSKLDPANLPPDWI